MRSHLVLAKCFSFPLRRCSIKAFLAFTLPSFLNAMLFIGETNFDEYFWMQSSQGGELQLATELAGGAAVAAGKAAPAGVQRVHVVTTEPPAGAAAEATIPADLLSVRLETLLIARPRAHVPPLTALRRGVHPFTGRLYGAELSRPPLWTAMQRPSRHTWMHSSSRGSSSRHSRPSKRQARLRTPQCIVRAPAAFALQSAS